MKTKKYFFALAALSMMTLVGLASCSSGDKEEEGGDEPAPSGLYAEVVELGKYIGVSLTDTKAGLADEGWTIVEDSSKAYRVGKVVDGSSVDLEINRDGTTCQTMTAEISDTNSIENGKTVLGDIGETYEFETLSKTANFAYFWGETSTYKSDVKTYDGAQEWLLEKGDSCIAFNSTWFTSDQTSAMSLEALRGKALIEVIFMQNVSE